MGTAFDTSKHQRILKYIELIQQKPKHGCEFFYFDANKKFVVNGDKLKIIPKIHKDPYDKDECYIHVDPNERKIAYYGFDIESYVSGVRNNEIEGLIEWTQEVEDSIYNFFVMNIKDLSSSIVPYVDVNEIGTTKPSNYHSSNSTYQPYTHTQPCNGTTDWHSSYKDREAFTEKLFGHLKANETAVAMDYIEESLTKLLKENKFGCIDDMLRFMSFDKLNIPTMIGLLSATKNVGDKLKDRKVFFNKVRDYIDKSKPGRSGKMLNGLEKGDQNVSV